MTTAIITMAGFGRRFLDAGYTIPKYRIEAHGHALFGWSMLSLRSFIAEGAEFVFVVRRADEARDFIVSEAARIGIKRSSVVELDEPTDGQATTAILAAPGVSHPDAPMLIYNIDTFVHPDALPASPRGDGWVPCFPGAGDGWSFAKADETGRISELREKVRISDDATIGLYWFSSFDSYAKIYGDYYSDPAKLEKGEKYVAPLYNRLIDNGRPVFVHRVPLSAVIPLGTPAEVERFLAMAPGDGSASFGWSNL